MRFVVTGRILKLQTFFIFKAVGGVSSGQFQASFATSTETLAFHVWFDAPPRRLKNYLAK